MFFESKISFKFLFEGKSQTLFILLGIAFGIAVQIFLSAIITGVQKNLIDQTIGTSAHITVKPLTTNSVQTKDDGVLKSTLYSRSTQENKRITGWEKTNKELNNMSEISTSAPVVDGSGFINSGERKLPVLVRGINIEQSENIYKFSTKITSGTSVIDANNVLIGSELAKDMNVSVGETITIVSANGVSDFFYIRGIFNFGNQNVNKTWIFMDLPRAQKFLDFNVDVSAIEIQLKKPFDSEKIAPVLRAKFKDVDFETWQQTNQQLLVALQSQSSSSNIIQFFVILAVALGISSVLAVSVMQKSRQIGILKAMGTTDNSIGLIFILQGAILGIFGGVLGCALGAGLIKLFAFLSSTGKGPSFTTTIDSSMLIFSIVVATVSSTFAAFFPSLRSMKLSPIEVIKNG